MTALYAPLMLRWRFVVTVTCLTVLLPTPCPTLLAQDQPPESSTASRQIDRTATETQREFFESHIRPVLLTQCYECHNSRDPQAGLALDHRQGLLEGGDSGPALRVGDLASRLLQAIRHDHDDLRMPVGKPKLDPRVIADFERWVNDGAFDPRDAPPTEADLAPEKLQAAIFAQRSLWWSFQPLHHATPPDARLPDGKTWSDQPIDRFVLHSMLSQGLVPASRADAATLVRRLSFALTGLPPTPEDIRHFASDPTPAAYEQLVDRYLHSTAFAERWARHWMDWIRYCETHGSEGDPAIPQAYQYRDYLIRAFAADVPFDQLLREHLAGDLLEHPRINRDLGINESSIGPAHLRMVFHGFAPTDAMEERVRFTDDQINTLTKAFLGLTVSCARCHDHKFDPVSQQDYYALFGILGSCRPGIVDANLPDQQERHKERLREIKQEVRNRLVEQWLKETEQLPERLLHPDTQLQDGMQKAESPESLLHPWREFAQSLSKDPQANIAVAAQQSVPESTKNLLTDAARQAEQQRKWFEAHPPLATTAGSEDPWQSWHHWGNGSADKRVSAGEFILATEGERLVSSILPAGVYSHLLSSRHRAVFASPKVMLDDDYRLVMLIAGEGNATSRYAVRDYPRDGTVYPVLRLNQSEWKWQTYDISYWRDDEIHLELATAPDGPIVRDGSPRSWFGLRAAVLLKSGEAPPPASNLIHWSPLASHVDEKNPPSLSQLAEAYRATTRQALIAWQAGTLTDEQSQWLHAIIQHGLLPNQLNEVPQCRDLVIEYRQLEQAVPEPTRVPGVLESSGRDQPLLARGDHRQPRESVARRFLSVFDDRAYAAPLSGRRELAESLLADSNPLTPRVMVNRFWCQVFGTGLVASPDNFGLLGSVPSHPELLDYLAAEFKSSGWSMRQLVRTLVLSEAWQQASTPSPEAQRLDPENRWLSHANVRRLEAEAIRDSILSISGALDPTPFGPGVDGGQPRRSVYVRVVRNALDPFLRVFDFPEPFATVGQRDRTNVPAQALTLLNDPQMIREAQRWADRTIAGLPARDTDHRLAAMFQAAFGREPAPAERDGFHQYIREVMELIEAQDQTRRQLNTARREEESAIAAIIEPVRKQFQEARTAPDGPRPPEPLARWEFDSLQDAVGTLHGTLKGNARLEQGALCLDGKQDYFITSPLTKPLREKTLEAWVKPDDLSQRGGGVLSVQSPDGVLFDAIVFGEQQPRRWLAGSDGFRRTQAFPNAIDEESTDRYIHIAITYREDGAVQAYREGEPYGDRFMVAEPITIAAGSVVTVGLRHLPATGNRCFRGRVERAQLYDRALTREEIRASHQHFGGAISDQQIWDALSPESQASVTQHRERVATLRAEIESLGPEDPRGTEARVWTEVARAIFCFKEFLYLQ